LIILDEPTNGLDPQGIADIRKLIQDLAKEGKTILVSSHLLAEIEQVATQILIIHKGKKVVAGSTQALLDPQMKIVQLKTLDDQLALQVLQTSSFSQYLLKRNQGLFLKMPTHEIPKLNASLIAAAVPIIGIEAKNSLEDYFLNITSNQ
jgi:ABC-2 type transport system ATP-binding protein